MEILTSCFSIFSSTRNQHSHTTNTFHPNLRIFALVYGPLRGSLGALHSSNLRLSGAEHDHICNDDSANSNPFTKTTFLSCTSTKSGRQEALSSDPLSYTHPL